MSWTESPTKRASLGRAAEAVERYPYGLGVGLVSGGRVAADDGIHEAGEPDVGEAAHARALRICS